uniref:ATP synthase complex subunit 8 n=1 Tax=Tenebrionoidea sp. 20 KM-2017 TaxID=2219476 RepID=A0A346RIL6_9CUCU|nr:ATP synthase F0 subunit 8 [Tenebrionoidea sp. 20 KM-2017]
MPQMAPLNWLTLMIFFIAALLVFNSLNYFSFTYKPSSSLKSKKEHTINWKW